MFKWLIKLFNYVPVKRNCRAHKKVIAVLLKENAELKKKVEPLRKPDESVNSKKSPGRQNGE